MPTVIHIDGDKRERRELSEEEWAEIQRSGVLVPPPQNRS